MSRFSNLEYDDDQPPGPQFEQVAHHGIKEQRDEENYARKADENFQQGHFEEALRFYSRALEFNPNFERGWVGQVRMLIELGELKEAGVWADKGLDIFRDHPELLSARSVVACRLGDREKALQFSDAASAKKGATIPYIWLARGEVLLATRGKNGQFCLEKAKTIAGASDWFTVLQAARIYYFYRHYSKGLEQARLAMELQPANAFVWFVLGNCQQALRLYKVSVESFRESLKLEPDFAPSKAALDSVENLGFFKRFLPFLSRFF